MARGALEAYPTPPHCRAVRQTYARDAKFLPAFQTKVWVEVTRAVYTDGGMRGVGSIRPDAQRSAQTKGARMWDLYSDLDHTNALDALRLQERCQGHVVVGVCRGRAALAET